MINMKVVGKKVAFDINERSAHEQSLKINSQLLGATFGYTLNDNMSLMITHMQTFAEESGDFTLTGSLTKVFFTYSWHDVLNRVQPILESMGSVIRCGELGCGNAVKLVTNYLWFTHAAVIGEGLLLGKQAGVSLDVLWDAIKRSVGDSFVARHDAPSIFAGHYDPSFTLALCLKDLALCEDLARRGGVPTPIGDTVTDRFRQAAAAYGEQSGELHVAKLLEDAVGTELRLDGDFTPHWEAS